MVWLLKMLPLHNLRSSDASETNRDTSGKGSSRQEFRQGCSGDGGGGGGQKTGGRESHVGLIVRLHTAKQ